MANQSLNPVITAALTGNVNLQKSFASNAKQVSENSRTAGNPAKDPAAFIAALDKRLSLGVKNQAKKNIDKGLAYLGVAQSGC